MQITHFINFTIKYKYFSLKNIALMYSKAFQYNMITVGSLGGAASFSGRVLQTANSGVSHKRIFGETEPGADLEACIVPKEVKFWNWYIFSSKTKESTRAVVRFYG